MTDRAVVDDGPIPGPGCDRCEGGLILVVGREKSWEETCPKCGPKPIPHPVVPQPRALVALSDDGQWLVMKPPQGDPHYPHRFFVYCWKRAYGLDFHKMIEDTGQDAHAVLAAFLEGHA